MELDVLRKRAELIPGINPSGAVICDGNITSVLVGVDIQVGKSKSPQVQIWRRASPVSSYFNKLNSREITLDAGNFTPIGVF